jgi:hypothetical protein
MRALVAIIAAMLFAPALARGDTSPEPDPELVARAIARADSGNGGYAPGSASAFVDRLCEDIARGADGEQLVEAFDLDAFAAGPGDARNNLKAFLDQDLQEARAEAARGEVAYLGWFVDEHVTQENGVTWVHVQVVTEVGGDVTVTEDRVGLRGGPHWKITDVVSGEISLREELPRMLVTPEQKISSLVDMIDGGQTGFAYTFAKSFVEGEPDSAELRAMFARVLFATYQLDAAEDEIEKVLAMRPDEPGTLALRARLHLARGNGAAARADAARAADLGSLPAAKLIEVLDVTDAARARYEGRRPDLRRGSAAAFVDDLVEQVARGRPIADLGYAFDPELWSLTKRRSVDAVTAVLTAELAPFGDDVRALGWHVSPNERLVDGRLHVALEIPVLTTISAAYRDKLVASLGGDTTGLDDGDLAVRDTIAKLPETVRASTFDGIDGIQVLTVANVDVVLVGDARAWRITDIVHDGQSLRAELPELETLHEPTPRARLATTTRLVIAAAVVAVTLVGLFVHHRRRRR